MSGNSQVAVITGASSGIGRAAAISLYKTGWTLVLVARREEGLKETISLLESKDGEEVRASYVLADLAKEEDIQKVFEHVKQKHGRLDLLFNNAGLNVPSIPMEQLTPAQYRSLMAVNVDACFYCSQEAIKIMKEQQPKGGRRPYPNSVPETGTAVELDPGELIDRIINNGSISAYTPRVFSAPYTMSKHAISGLTKCISLDGREDNIVCSQLDIGGAGTEIQGKNERLQPNGQVVKEALFDVKLAGDAVAYMANLPLSVNVLSQTIMATTMPYIGRG